MASTDDWSIYLELNLTKIRLDLTNENSDIVRQTLVELMNTANVNVDSLREIWETVEYFPEGDQFIPECDNELKKFARAVNDKLSKIDELVKTSLLDYKRVANDHLKNIETYIKQKNVTTINHYATAFTTTSKKAERLEATESALTLMKSLREKAQGKILPKNCYIPSDDNPTVDQVYTNLASRDFPAIATIVAARQIAQTAVMIGDDKIGFIDNEKIRLIPTVGVSWTDNKLVCKKVEHHDSVLVGTLKLPINLRTGDAKRFKEQFISDEFEFLTSKPMAVTIEPASTPEQKLNLSALKILKLDEPCTYFIDENRAVFYVILGKDDALDVDEFLKSDTDIVGEALREIGLVNDIEPPVIALRFPLEVMLINNIGRFMNAQTGKDVKTLILPVRKRLSQSVITTDDDSFVDVMAACLKTFSRPAFNIRKSSWIQAMSAIADMAIENPTVPNLVFNLAFNKTSYELIGGLEWMKNLNTLRFNSGSNRRKKKISDADTDFNNFTLLTPSQVTMKFGEFKDKHDFLNDNRIWQHFRKLMLSASTYTTVNGYRNMVTGYLKGLQAVEGDVPTEFLKRMGSVGNYDHLQAVIKKALKLAEPMVKTWHNGTIAKLTEDIANLTIVTKEMEAVKDTNPGKINDILQGTIDRAHELESDYWGKNTLNEKETADYVAYIESTRQVISELICAEQTILNEIESGGGDKDKLRTLKRTFRSVRKPLQNTSTKCMDNLATMVEGPGDCDLSPISSNNSADEEAETTVVAKKTPKVHDKKEKTEKPTPKNVSFGKEHTRTFAKGETISDFTEGESTDSDDSDEAEEVIQRMGEVIEKNKRKKRPKKKKDDQENRKEKDASEPEEPSDSSDSSEDSDDSEDEDHDRNSRHNKKKKKNKKSKKKTKKKKKRKPVESSSSSDSSDDDISVPRELGVTAKNHSVLDVEDNEEDLRALEMVKDGIVGTKAEAHVRIYRQDQAIKESKTAADTSRHNDVRFRGGRKLEQFHLGTLSPGKHNDPSYFVNTYVDIIIRRRNQKIEVKKRELDPLRVDESLIQLHMVAVSHDNLDTFHSKSQEYKKFYEDCKKHNWVENRGDCFVWFAISKITRIASCLAVGENEIMTSYNNPFLYMRSWNKLVNALLTENQMKRWRSNESQLTNPLTHEMGMMERIMRIGKCIDRPVEIARDSIRSMIETTFQQQRHEDIQDYKERLIIGMTIAFNKAIEEFPEIPKERLSIIETRWVQGLKDKNFAKFFAQSVEKYNIQLESTLNFIPIKSFLSAINDAEVGYARYPKASQETGIVRAVKGSHSMMNKQDIMQCKACKTTSHSRCELTAPYEKKERKLMEINEMNIPYKDKKQLKSQIYDEYKTIRRQLTQKSEFLPNLDKPVTRTNQWNNKHQSGQQNKFGQGERNKFPRNNPHQNQGFQKKQGNDQNANQHNFQRNRNQSGYNKGFQNNNYQNNNFQGNNKHVTQNNSFNHNNNHRNSQERDSRQNNAADRFSKFNNNRDRSSKFNHNQRPAQNDSRWRPYPNQNRTTPSSNDHKSDNNKEAKIRTIDVQNTFVDEPIDEFRIRMVTDNQKEEPIYSELDDENELKIHCDALDGQDVTPETPDSYDEAEEKAQLNNILAKLKKLHARLKDEICASQHPSTTSIPSSNTESELSFKYDDESPESDIDQTDGQTPSNFSGDGLHSLSRDVNDDSAYYTFPGNHELLRSKIVWSRIWSLDVIAQSTFERLTRNATIESFQVPGNLDIKETSATHYEIEDVLSVNRTVNLRIDDKDYEFRLIPDYLFMEMLTLIALEEFHGKVYHKLQTENYMSVPKLERRFQNKFRDKLIITGDHKLCDSKRRYAQIYNCPKSPLRITSKEQSLIAYQEITEDFVTSEDFIGIFRHHDGQIPQNRYLYRRCNPTKLDLKQTLDPETLKVLISKYETSLIYVNEIPYDVRVVPHQLYLALLTAEAAQQQKVFPRGPRQEFGHHLVRAEIPNKQDYEFYANTKLIAAPFNQLIKIEAGQGVAMVKQRSLNPKEITKTVPTQSFNPVHPVTNTIRNAINSVRRNGKQRKNPGTESSSN